MESQSRRALARPQVGVYCGTPRKSRSPDVSFDMTTGGWGRLCEGRPRRMKHQPSAAGIASLVIPNMTVPPSRLE